MIIPNPVMSMIKVKKINPIAGACLIDTYWLICFFAAR